MQYDYIFAGAGGAALSLAYRLNHSALHDKKILLIDQSPKDQNDRTWCFWTKDFTLFDAVVSKVWDKIWFHSPTYSKEINLAPYQYKMIRGKDFYDFVLNDLTKNPNIEWLFGKIEDFQSTKQGVIAQVEGKTYKGHWGFNSLPPKLETEQKQYHYLWQHFKGWVIETDRPVFTPDTATFMDFRIEQHDEARFFYLLPTSSTRSLVEFTIFEQNILRQEEYEAEIKAYISEYLQVENYTILETEFGVIPMTNQPLKIRHSPHIINIGSAGGRTKASTGFTFANIQRQADLILKALLEEQAPFYQPSFEAHYQLYDAILLDVMANNRYPARDIFRTMFEKHPIERVFRFLDNESSFWEDLQIITSVPSLPFMKGLGSLWF